MLFELKRVPCRLEVGGLGDIWETGCPASMPSYGRYGYVANLDTTQ
jgi:hypothetical protein